MRPTIIPRQQYKLSQYYTSHYPPSLQRVPDDKIVIVLVLFADILFTLSREIIILATLDEENQRSAGIATVVMFVFSPALFLGVFSAHYMFCIIKCSIKSHGSKKIKIIFVLVQIVATLLYFYGDNINFIVRTYGDELGCGDQCVENNRIAAVVTSGLALLMFYVLPPVLKTLFKIS